MSNQSKCSFCNSTSFGKGCPWSPYKGTHYHGDLNGKKCAWCNSNTIVGRNCPFSPTGFHGATSNAFNQMLGESFYLGYMMNLLSQPYTESKAFQLGLINEYGHKIKTPQSDEELDALSPITEYIFKIKHMLGNKLELINNATYLEQTTKKAQFSVENYSAELHLKNKMQSLSKEFYKLVQDSLKEGLTFSDIQKIIIEKLSICHE